MSSTHGSGVLPVDEAKLEELAFHNALSFQRLKDDLVHMRIESGVSQAKVGELLGVSQSAIAQVEAEGNNPKLATLRAYALAVGARVSITVTREDSISYYPGSDGARTAKASWGKGASGAEGAHSSSASVSEKKSSDFVFAA